MVYIYRLSRAVCVVGCIYTDISDKRLAGGTDILHVFDEELLGDIYIYIHIHRFWDASRLGIEETV